MYSYIESDPVLNKCLCCFSAKHASLQGRIQDFKLGGAHLKKLRRAEGGANIFGVFRVKNHDFTPKNLIFPILGGAREIFGVFHVKNHDFTPKKIIFLPILGGGAHPWIRPCIKENEQILVGSDSG